MINNHLNIAKQRVKQHSIATIKNAIASVTPFLTRRRQQRIDQLLDYRLNNIHVAVESPSNPHNAAAIVRSCDAFGITHIHVTNTETSVLHAKGTTQGAFHWLNTYHHLTFADLLAYLRQLNFDDSLQQANNKGKTKIVIAGAVLDSKRKLEDLPIDQPLCLLFGNEKDGLSNEASRHIDIDYSIPMVGMSESLNLSVAAAISLYSVSQRKRQWLQKTTDLEENDKEALRLYYYGQSLDKRLLKTLLAKYGMAY